MHRERLPRCQPPTWCSSTQKLPVRTWRRLLLVDFLVTWIGCQFLFGIIVFLNNWWIENCEPEQREYMDEIWIRAACEPNLGDFFLLSQPSFFFQPLDPIILTALTLVWSACVWWFVIKRDYKWKFVGCAHITKALVQAFFTVLVGVRIYLIDTQEYESDWPGMQPLLQRVQLLALVSFSFVLIAPLYSVYLGVLMDKESRWREEQGIAECCIFSMCWMLRRYYSLPEEEEDSIKAVRQELREVTATMSEFQQQLEAVKATMAGFQEQLDAKGYLRV